jgi:hypothetical protein
MHSYRYLLQILSLAWVEASAAQVQAAAPRREGATFATEKLSEDGIVRRAISLYDSGQYELCVDTFQQLLDPEEPTRLRSPSKIETARVYYGVCLIGVGRTLEAEAVFRLAILENPQMKTPDSLLFPEAVVELFLRVRESMLDEIRKAEQKRLKDAEVRAAREARLRRQEAARVEQLMKLAETESVVEQRSRYVSFVPFGVGQFQNRNPGLGWFFLGSETVATAVFVSSLYMTSWYGSKTDDRGVTPQRLRELSAAQRDAYWISAASGWGLLGLGLAGIIEANLAFKSETRTERRRQLPHELRQLRPPNKVPADLSFMLVPCERAGACGVLSGRF